MPTLEAVLPITLPKRPKRDFFCGAGADCAAACAVESTVESCAAASGVLAFGVL
jgi:hypothetical protein